MATQYYTDKTGFMHSREIFPTGTIPGAITAVPAGESSTTGVYGFGVAITGSSCYLLNQMQPQERQALLQRIYGKEGLNLSLGRLSIGASDYSAELYSYDDVPFDTTLEHFSVARDEAYVIPMIREILKIKPELYLFASPWSPPAWMKTGNSLCGGHMREEFVECYAEYFIKFIKAYAAHGIQIRAVSPQNEPETHQDGRMPACIWNPETEARFIKCLRKRLDEEGLDVKIWMWDYRFTGIDRVLWSLDTIQGLEKACDGVAFHYYRGNIESTRCLRTLHPRLELHFTEGGPRLYDHYDSDWCKWGMMIAKAFACGYRSLTGWNLMLDETGGPNIGPYYCGGLVTRNSLTGELSFSGQAKAMAHVAPYITPQSRIYPLETNEVSYDPMFRFPKHKEPLEGFLIENEDATVCFLVNPDGDKKQVRFYAKEQWWYAELLPDAVCTIIL